MNLKMIKDNFDNSYNYVYGTEVYYYDDGTKTVEWKGYEVDYDTLNRALYSIYSDNGLFSYFRNPDKDEDFKKWCRENARIVKETIRDIYESQTYQNLNATFAY